MPKPKDFTESAVNLCNPPEVKELLDRLALEQSVSNDIEGELKAQNSELMSKWTEAANQVLATIAEIKAAVEEKGSYQSLEDERYAVKYGRKTAVYDNLPSFKKNFPKFVELCVKETLDINALKGQVKGKLITEEQLEKTKVLTYDESFAFYVR